MRRLPLLLVLTGCSVLTDPSRFVGHGPEDSGTPPSDSGPRDAGPQPPDGGRDAGRDGGPPAPPCADTTIRQISAGGTHTCVLYNCGVISCWGDTGAGQLGDGTGRETHVPVFVQNIDDARAIRAGARQTCAIRSNGSVWCWGANMSGGVGDGSGADRAVPVQVQDIDGALFLSRGATTEHTCASIGSSPNAACWGPNEYGQIGDTTTIPATGAHAVATMLGPLESLAVALHTCAVTTAGSLYCWGSNGGGELGDGSGMSQSSPVAIAGLPMLTDVAAGIGSTCVLTSTREVRCWGANRYGQLGDGSMTPQPLASAATANTAGPALDIVAGSEHYCTLRQDGFASCWGRNNRGQLGLGVAGDAATPTSVADVSDLVMISSGAQHACALRSDQAMFCWGANDFGQLGNGTTGDRNAPVRVVGLLTTAP